MKGLLTGPLEKRRCRDHFLDCPQFRDYCKRISFYFIMRSYCPYTCGRCKWPSGEEEEIQSNEWSMNNKLFYFKINIWKNYMNN
jgi:hypothetical protein